MEAAELTWAGEIALRTLREALLDIVQIKFGQVSPAMQAVVDGAETEEELRGLIKRAATAQTERELVQANRHERT